MKRFFIICFFVSLILSINVAQTHATESDATVVVFENGKSTSEGSSNEESPVTIKQMKENLEELKNEKEDISSRWETLNAINGRVVDYLRTDLGDTDISEIETLSKEYQKRSQFYEEQLKNNSQENYATDTTDDNDTAAIKKNFIEYKVNFYKALVPYIDISKKDAYLDYIKGNIVIEKEEKDIKEKIYKQEESIEERVDTIKEKIKQHNKTLEEKIEQIIRQRINEKLDVIFSSETVSGLSIEKKASLLNQVIEKLNQNKEKLSSENSDSEFIKKKIAIYEVAILVIQERINTLK